MYRERASGKVGLATGGAPYAVIATLHMARLARGRSTIFRQCIHLFQGIPHPVFRP